MLRLPVGMHLYFYLISACFLVLSGTCETAADTRAFEAPGLGMTRPSAYGEVGPLSERCGTELPFLWAS